MSPTTKFILLSTLIVVATALGYLARRRGWASERLGQRLMTLVVVVGYSATGFLAVWPMQLVGSDVWLPVLAAAHIVILSILAMAVGPLLSAERAERGTFTLAACFGNNGFTMGAFVAFVLFGRPALALAAVYGLMAIPLVVLFFYPLAHYYSSAAPRGSLVRLIRTSIFDWRSIGLPAVLLGVCLSPSGLNVHEPDLLASTLLLDVLMFLVTAVAYFAIGLRLHLSHVPALARMLGTLAAFRFVLGPLLAFGLLALTALTPWPLDPLRHQVFMVVTVVPTAVTSVALSNMFALKPREASVLFVANTLLYLVLILPFVVWYYH